MSRQRLGPIVGLGPGGRVLVDLEEVPRLGTRVQEENGRPAGRLVDVIGPVNEPVGVVRGRKGQRMPTRGVLWSR